MMDVDSTLIDQEVIDELARIAGLGDVVSQITARAMAGELDFESALRERVKLLKGQPLSILDEVQQRITLTHGARELLASLKSQGVKVGVVTGGFEEVILPIVEDLEIDFLRGNKLGVENGSLTGEVEGSIIGRNEKAEALRDFSSSYAIPLGETIAVGDGANDIEMIKSAGLGIAFCAKEVLRVQADISIEIRDLKLVLDYFL